MTAVHDDPGLRFWLRAVAEEGALSETADDATLVVLPPALQATLGLPEEVAVTADPEVAREDGTLLLAAGHPALDSMAARVLERGEAGQGWLAWPRSEPPSAPALLERIRERFPVDHGRIDPAGPIELCYAPVLRVAALVTYTASLDLRFQERETVEVDGVTGTALEEATVRALAQHPTTARSHVRHRTLSADLPTAIAGADALLRRRAAQREQVLAAEAVEARHDELARLDAYYEGVLATIARRRANADEQRRRLLDDQAAVTHEERDRRRREVDEQFRPTTDLRPVLLHLVNVPAARLAVRIRRGSNTYPFAFVWLLPAQDFTPVRCPSCGAVEQLAAGRKRLGCAACQPRPAARDTAGPPSAAAGPPPAGPADDEATPAGDAAGPAGVERAAGPASRESPSPPSRQVQAPRSRPAPSPPSRPAQAPRSKPAPSPPSKPAQAPRSTPRKSQRRSPSTAAAPARKVLATGDRLGLEFWQAVACGERWHRKKLVADAPLQTAYWLWGAAAPGVAIGLPPAAWPIQVTAATAAPEPGLPQATTGVVVASDGSPVPYTLFWDLVGGKPRLIEVVPFGSARTPALPPLGAADPKAVRWLGDRAPAPRHLDDRVTAQLWRVEPAVAGVPATVRCITAWRRAGWQNDGAASAVVDGAAPEVVAAALASILSSWAGRRRSRSAAADDHGADPDAVTRTARTLQRHLAPSRQRPW